MNKNSLFEFDKNISGHCEEGQSPDAAIQNVPLTAHSSQSTILIGTDEAGRGPGAGGVFASAVCFQNPSPELIEKLSSLNDSKKLTKKKREELYDIIIENTINSTVCVEVEEIEEINILNASLKAMKLACSNVIALCSPLEGTLPNKTIEYRFVRGKKSVDFEGGQKQQNVLVLVDGNKLIKDFYPPSQPSPSRGEGAILQQFIIKGDSKSASIAAASILAKVTRDRYMESLHEKFPQYNWIKNAGYLTKEHLSAIDRYGITPHHRKSFLRKHNEKCNTIQLTMCQK